MRRPQSSRNWACTDVAVIGLAKRLEEVWVPSEPDPIIFPRNSEGLYLLQRVRDEAHRFAISYHRSKRSKRMTASALDSVRGLGEQRRKALVTHFGSVARLKEATVEEITAVPGIGVTTARAVLAALGGEPPVGHGGGPPIEHGGEPPVNQSGGPPIEHGGGPPIEHGGDPGPRIENSAGLGGFRAPATVIEDDRRRVSG